MAITVAEILAGAYKFYIGPQGEAIEIDDLAPPAVTVTVAGNWREVETMDDQTFNCETTFQEVFSNKHLAPVKLIETAEAITIGVSMLQGSMQSFADAINLSTFTTVAAGASQSAQDRVRIGDKASTTEFSLLFIGTSPEAGDRVVLVHKAVQMDAAEIVWKKEHSGMNIGWKCIADPSQAAGETLVELTDITATPTS